ncbi:histone-lysine N-methyltransferase SETDB, partial [Clonorchis sinensis]
MPTLTRVKLPSNKVRVRISPEIREGNRQLSNGFATVPFTRSVLCEEQKVIQLTDDGYRGQPSCPSKSTFRSAPPPPPPPVPVPDNPVGSETRGQAVVENHVAKSEDTINSSDKLENTALDLRVNGTPTRHRANESGSAAAFSLMSDYRNVTFDEGSQQDTDYVILVGSGTYTSGLATECAAPGRLMFDILVHSYLLDYFLTGHFQSDVYSGSNLELFKPEHTVTVNQPGPVNLQQLNVLHQAASCSSCYDIRDIAIYVYSHHKREIQLGSSPINLNQPAVVAIQFLCFKLVYDYHLHKLRIQSVTQYNHYRKGRNSALPPKFIRRPQSNQHYHTFDYLACPRPNRKVKRRRIPRPPPPPPPLPPPPPPHLSRFSPRQQSPSSSGLDGDDTSDVDQNTIRRMPSCPRPNRKVKRRRIPRPPPPPPPLPPPPPPHLSRFSPRQQSPSSSGLDGDDTSDVDQNTIRRMPCRGQLITQAGVSSPEVEPMLHSSSIAIQSSHAPTYKEAPSIPTTKDHARVDEQGFGIRLDRRSSAGVSDEATFSSRCSSASDLLKPASFHTVAPRSDADPSSTAVLPAHWNSTTDCIPGYTPQELADAERSLLAEQQQDDPSNRGSERKLSMDEERAFSMKPPPPKRSPFTMLTKLSFLTPSSNANGLEVPGSAMEATSRGGGGRNHDYDGGSSGGSDPEHGATGWTCGSSSSREGVTGNVCSSDNSSTHHDANDRSSLSGAEDDANSRAAAAAAEDEVIHLTELLSKRRESEARRHLMLAELEADIERDHRLQAAANAMALAAVSNLSPSKKARVKSCDTHSARCARHAQIHGGSRQHNTVQGQRPSFPVGIQEEDLLISLTKTQSGLGFSLTTKPLKSLSGSGLNNVDMMTICVKNILPGGAALKDGQLRLGDRILRVDDQDVMGKTQAQIVSMLRVKPVGSVVNLLVRRQLPCSLTVPRHLVLSSRQCPGCLTHKSADASVKPLFHSASNTTTSVPPVGNHTNLPPTERPTYRCASPTLPERSSYWINEFPSIVTVSNYPPYPDVFILRLDISLQPTCGVNVPVATSTANPSPVNRKSPTDDSSASSNAFSRHMRLGVSVREANSSRASKLADKYDGDPEKIGSLTLGRADELWAGADSVYGGILVKGIIEDGAAHRDGRLRVGDELLEVNGVSLVNVNNPLGLLRSVLRQLTSPKKEPQQQVPTTTSKSSETVDKQAGSESALIPVVQLLVARQTRHRRSASGHTSQPQHPATSHSSTESPNSTEPGGASNQVSGSGRAVQIAADVHSPRLTDEIKPDTKLNNWEREVPEPPARNNHHVVHLSINHQIMSRITVNPSDTISDPVGPVYSSHSAVKKLMSESTFIGSNMRVLMLSSRLILDRKSGDVGLQATVVGLEPRTFQSVSSRHYNPYPTESHNHEPSTNIRTIAVASPPGFARLELLCCLKIGHAFLKGTLALPSLLYRKYLLVGHPNDFGRQFIVYNAPCGRQLRSMHEVQRFLDRTDSKLTTDLFSFDPNLCINSEFRAEKTFTHIADISYGKENVPVPCVNSIDNEVPGYIDYIPSRLPIGDVPLIDDDSFVVCCDCTDNCRDRTKCACQQLTAEASSLTNPTGMVDTQAGYRYRRLAQFTVGGIYECNSRCSCDRRCSNRVVQQGLWFRLQVFKTSRKGWGIRALHAIPKGTFLCTYAGAIYDETMAVQEGFDYGDEYQAELDYIETVEKTKEGYESAPEDPEDVDLALQQAASQFGDRKPEKDAEYDRQNDSDSSSSHSTNTEMDDDRGSRCSDFSSTSSSRNAVGSAEPLALRRSGLRSSVTRPTVAEESSLPTDSEQLSTVDKTLRHVQSSNPSLTTLDSPEIRRAGSDPDSPCPLISERRLSVDFSEEPMDIAAPVFPSINGSEDNVANCSSDDRAIPPEYDSDSGDVSCCTNVSITLEHMELASDSCLSGIRRSPPASATDLSATSAEAKAVPKAPSSASLNPIPNEDPKGFEIPLTHLEGQRIVLARKTVCRGQALRKSPAAGELEQKECDMKDEESENKMYTRVKLEEMSDSDSKALSSSSDKKESDTKQTPIGRRSASAKQLRTPPKLYENEVKRHTRARFRARSISLPLQYTALHSVRRIVDRVDFGRIPQIKLARLSHKPALYHICSTSGMTVMPHLSLHSDRPELAFQQNNQERYYRTPKASRKTFMALRIQGACNGDIL